MSFNMQAFLFVLMLALSAGCLYTTVAHRWLPFRIATFLLGAVLMAAAFGVGVP